MPITLETTIDIDAPIERVWSILIDLGSYAEWNPFTPRVDSTLKLGEPCVLHVQMVPGKKRIVQKETITANDPTGHELGWGTTLLAPFLLKANRVQRLTSLGADRTRYWTGDTFSGVLTPLVMALYRRHIQRGFDYAAIALKARAEEQP